MDFDPGFLRTRIARRILLLFILCALAPTTALAVISWNSVRNQLRTQSLDRLRGVSKNAGMVVAERLQFLHQRMTGLEASLASAPGVHPGFTAVATGTPGRSFSVLDGAFPTPAPLEPAEVERLRRGEPVLRMGTRTATGDLVLVQPSSSRSDLGAPSLLWARIDPDFLWNSAEGYAALPTTAGLCVVTAEIRPLHCTIPRQEAFLSELRAAMENRSETFTWSTPEGDGYLAAHWEAFLEPLFGSPSLHVAVTESRQQVLAPAASFQNSFLGVTALALVVVALLGNVQVRRSLRPVEKLTAATRRIADRDFETRVEVESDDEFEELGHAFNLMARRIGAQFSALKTISEVDRAILSSLQPGRIAESILAALPDIVPADRVALAFLDRGDSGTGILHVRTPDGNPGEPPRPVRLDPAQRRRLESDPGSVLEEGDETPPYLSSDAGDGDPGAGMVAPFFIDGELAGFLSVRHDPAVTYADDERERLRQVADQTAVALANARLLEDLERMNWGSLTALARAIDAKSAWTAGHSERVRTLTGRLARVLGLSEDEVERLERGALVHDIGKIGIPGYILNKEGGLTADEREYLQEHTRMGARILEPIPAMESVIPMVLHHHERWDGSGYPDELRGEEIPRPARILAVADTYDALISDRPYRSGLPPDVARNFILGGSGTLFDPRVVDGFRSILDELREAEQVPGAAE